MRGHGIRWWYQEAIKGLSLPCPSPLQIGQLQAKIVAEDKVVELKTVELLQEWERGKPSQVSCHFCASSV